MKRLIRVSSLVACAGKSYAESSWPPDIIAGPTCESLSRKVFVVYTRPEAEARRNEIRQAWWPVMGHDTSLVFAVGRLPPPPEQGSIISPGFGSEQSTDIREESKSFSRELGAANESWDQYRKDPEALIKKVVGMDHYDPLLGVIPPGEGSAGGAFASFGFLRYWTPAVKKVAGSDGWLADLLVIDFEDVYENLWQKTAAVVNWLASCAVPGASSASNASPNSGSVSPIDYWIKVDADMTVNFKTLNRYLDDLTCVLGQVREIRVLADQADQSGVSYVATTKMLRTQCPCLTPGCPGIEPSSGSGQAEESGGSSQAKEALMPVPAAFRDGRTLVVGSSSYAESAWSVWKRLADRFGEPVPPKPNWLGMDQPDADFANPQLFRWMNAILKTHALDLPAANVCSIHKFAPSKFGLPRFFAIGNQWVGAVVQKSGANREDRVAAAYYPPYLSGPAYVFSADALPHLAQQLPYEDPQLANEDAALGLLIDHLRIPPPTNPTRQQQPTTTTRTSPVLLTQIHNANFITALRPDQAHLVTPRTQSMFAWRKPTPENSKPSECSQWIVYPAASLPDDSACYDPTPSFVTYWWKTIIHHFATKPFLQY